MYRFKAGVFCVILSAFAASVLAVDLDTAFVPFLVNADARVTAANGEIVIFIDTEADKEAILRLPLAKTLGVTRRSQNANNTPVITGSHNGKISLNLPGQNYKTAELALYTVNGKQIMRTKADASRAVNNIARPNLASGVYLLSVKGANGQSFSSRLTHRGGSLNISIAFGNESFLTSSPVAVSAAAPGSNDWTITVSAEGHIDSSYTLWVAAGNDNNLQEIDLIAWGEWEPTTPAACDSAGVETRASTKAGDDRTEARPIPKLCGDWVITTPATCDAAGERTRSVKDDDPQIEVLPRWLCSDAGKFNPDITYGFFTDTRVGANNRTYRTVEIGGKTWFAENLHYAGESSNIGVCYSNTLNNCNIYGRLYTWTEAMNIGSEFSSTMYGSGIDTDVQHQGICPVGWRLPNYDDWSDLERAVGGSSTAGTRLKSQTGWSSGGNGTNEFGWSALPGGRRAPPAGTSAGTFTDVNNIGYWWSATETVMAGLARERYITSSPGMTAIWPSKRSWFSVRCVMD